MKVFSSKWEKTGNPSMCGSHTLLCSSSKCAHLNTASSCFQGKHPASFSLTLVDQLLTVNTGNLHLPCAAPTHYCETFVTSVLCFAVSPRLAQPSSLHLPLLLSESWLSHLHFWGFLLSCDWSKVHLWVTLCSSVTSSHWCISWTGWQHLSLHWVPPLAHLLRPWFCCSMWLFLGLTLWPLVMATALWTMLRM